MNSKELGNGAQNYVAVSNRILEIAVQRGTEAGIKAAMEYLEESKTSQQKGRYDRRLRNTRLLLKNYRVFKSHAQGAVYKATQAKEKAVDILDGLDEFSFDDGLYVESIKKSQQRTIIILKHIEEMLRYYQIDCEQSHKDEEMRRYRIIMDYYIQDDKKSAEEIAEKEHIERRTVYKDINIALKPLSALIFGIDSMKLY
ncbi:MAG: hypothetical protein LBS36_07710 [Oscillospiraceae bacterium]|jgi:hypothetical protein|nr:hypothetical protein [Oscillospiraceae bacterium]